MNEGEVATRGSEKKRVHSVETERTESCGRKEGEESKGRHHREKRERREGTGVVLHFPKGTMFDGIALR
jgi:hypothetical protein